MQANNPKQSKLPDDKLSSVSKLFAKNRSVPLKVLSEYGKSAIVGELRTTGTTVERTLAKELQPSLEKIARIATYGTRRRLSLNGNLATQLAILKRAEKLASSSGSGDLSSEMQGSDDSSDESTFELSPRAKFLAEQAIRRYEEKYASEMEPQPELTWFRRSKPRHAE